MGPRRHAHTCAADLCAHVRRMRRFRGGRRLLTTSFSRELAREAGGHRWRLPGRPFFCPSLSSARIPLHSTCPVIARVRSPAERRRVSASDSPDTTDRLTAYNSPPLVRVSVMHSVNRTGGKARDWLVIQMIKESTYHDTHHPQTTHGDPAAMAEFFSCSKDFFHNLNNRSACQMVPRFYFY